MNPDLDQLAEGLNEMRRWFDHEVERVRLGMMLEKQILDSLKVMRPDLEEWDRCRAAALSSSTAANEARPPGRWPKRPPDRISTVRYWGEIEKAARGEHPAPIEWLWLINVDQALDDDELASILSPERHQRDRVGAIRAIAKMRGRAHEWLDRACGRP